MSQGYASDLTPKQWEVIEPLIPPQDSGGRNRTVNIREISSTEREQGVPGNFCQMTFHRNQRFMSTIVLGNAMEPGREFTMLCERWCGKTRAVTAMLRLV